MLALAVAPVLTSGCAGEEEAPAQAQAPGLSNAFGAHCTSCHGAAAEGTAKAPSLPNGRDQEAYIGTVRSGRGREMPAFDEAKISDADLRADWSFLTR